MVNRPSKRYGFPKIDCDTLIENIVEMINITKYKSNILLIQSVDINLFKCFRFLNIQSKYTIPINLRTNSLGQTKKSFVPTGKNTRGKTASEINTIFAMMSLLLTIKIPRLLYTHYT